MRALTRTDPAGLARGPLTRWLPVLWQASAEPPEASPFPVTAGMRPGRFLAQVLLSVKGFTIPAAVLAIVWQVGESAVPVVMGLAIDRALATGDSVQLLLWLAVLASVFTVLTVASRLAQQLTVYVTQLVQHRLRATLSAAVLHPVGTTARQPDGGVVSVMTNDVGRLAAVGLVVHPVGEVAAIGFIAVSLLLIHWPLGLSVLIGAPLVVCLTGLLSERLSRDTRVYQELLASTVARASDLVSGYRVIKGVRAEAEATRRYREASQEALDGARRNVGLLGRFLVSSSAVSGVFVAAVAGLAAWFAVAGQLSIGGLIAAVGLTRALLPQMRMLAMNAVPALAGARASAARVLELLLETTTAPQSTPGAPDTVETTPDPSTGPAVPVVEVSVAGHGMIRIEAGEMVGVRADDPAATSIADALLNPHIDHDICVRIDGAPSRNVDLSAYRSRVTVAPHQVILFSGTIADNLARPGAPAGLQDAALRAAACDDFTGADGLDVPVGENGNRLSGGQRQRVALARALACDAPVLVLHDPTTAVDSVTETAIASRLRGIRADRSTLLIASSPALLDACDRIVDLRGGKPALREESTR